jgi:hypothetical protein
MLIKIHILFGKVDFFLYFCRYIFTYYVYKYNFMRKDKKSPFPAWVVAHKEKNTEIRCLGGKYF